jgi:hypothetical protein
MAFYDRKNFTVFVQKSATFRFFPNPEKHLSNAPLILGFFVRLKNQIRTKTAETKMPIFGPEFEAAR